ncbi:alanyl-tRNA editing protein [Halorarum halobium]|uniref:alanyl-tRNA editing protein n=1 Tax=Halorarum halobium TaxID=3075121 RepID=UPI0028B01E67|nr:DHHA1 domain-containing protein [Halobaculum sp. XH14]
MSGTLAPEAPEVREFTATVERVDGDAVELDETYFYAESGGQPADRGTLDGVAVETVQVEDGTVTHELAESPDFAAGDEVAGVVDDDFRTYCMRAHTASHLLYGAGQRLLDDLGYGGFDISPEKVRVDFTTTTDIDDGTLVELERLVNRAVWDSLPVSWAELPVGEARAQADVAFNTKTEEGVMADAATVRVVTIEGWDRAACGGTHVSNTAEIGPVTVRSRSNPGEGMTRVEFSVGPPAVRAAAERHGAARTTARELDSSTAEMPTVAAALREERDELEAELTELRGEVVETELRSFERVEADGATWLLGSVSGFDANTVGERAKAVASERDLVVAAVEAGPSPFVVVAAEGDVHAGDVVEELTDVFGGGGGGGPPFAQGGGVNADASELLDWLRTYASEK